MNAPTSFPFGKELKSYRVGTVETPFKQRGQDFDHAFGDYIRRAYHWRLGFFLSALLSFLLIIIILISLNTSPYKVFSISLSNHGLVTQSGIIENHYSINENSYRDVLVAMLRSFHVQGKTGGIASFISKTARQRIEKYISINDLSPSFLIKNFKIRAGGRFSADLYTDKKKIAIVGRFEKSIFINEDLIKLNPFGLYLKNISFDIKEHKEEKVN